MNQKKAIQTPNAPKAVGPYSQGIQYGSLIFASGQTGIDPATGIMPDGGIEAQTKQAMANLEAVLKAAGSEMNKVLKTTVFITNMNDFSLVNKIYESFFQQNPPARSCVEVSALPKNALVEVEAIAFI
jgi:2-iminobutanoate/2-iminopropanoate deaminase